MTESDKPTVDNLPAVPPGRKHRPAKTTEGKAGVAKRAGRPSLLTAQTQRRICDGISKGLFIAQAAKLAGVSPDAVESWRTKGSEGVEPYKSFVEAFERAELECEAMLVERWKALAPEDWRACKEFLAKRFPARWSDHASRVAVLGNSEIGRGSGPNVIIHME
jgi:hypothetical protein